MNNILNPLIETIDKAIKAHQWGEEPKELYEPIGYIMSLGGKRLRPLLTLLGYRLFNDDIRPAIAPAMAVETFHNFTLVHDDIMDKAPLRRGKETVHTKWNDNIAILSGDVMMIKVYDHLLELDPEILPAALKAFNANATEVCEGQQKDMNFESRDDVTAEEYLDMIRQKTAVLLGLALQLGAMVAKAPEEIQSGLYDFAVKLGIGFQLKDDLLDVYGDQAKFGKQVGGDIIENKKTYLLIKAKELASGELAAELEKWIAHENPIAEDKVKAVTEIYNQLDIKNITEQLMQSSFEEAFGILESMPLNEQQKTYLSDFATIVINREK
ncbi:MULTISPECIES: polyprenyl synthetase family protein [Persicobacter]|uniref:Isoprenyl synthetase n=1 Tax=Persicobacter diffluens TaxID=981 RepID=A0AAN4VYU7_9BACT|nr:polyprenyl synthetase family protein [Persicobacter sp. CCB-QB2]GJM61262.1 isoprenyl synthetase [Persicobacter diffluens]